jgi:hypothetical protein
MKRELWFLAALTGVAAGGCMLEIGEPGVDGVYEDEVAVSRSELSSIETRGDVVADRFVGFQHHVPIFFRFGGENCSPPNALVETNSEDGHLVERVTSTCRTVSRVASSGFFYADFTADDIVRSLLPGGTKLIDTLGDARGIFADSSHVYWADGNGLRKLRKDGASVTTLVSDPSLTLRALRGTTLYYSKALPNNVHELRRISTAGGNSAVVVTYTSTTGFKDFAVDSSGMYWVDNTQATNRVRRLSHALGAAVTTVISDAQDTYGLTTGSDNGMHFVQWSPDGFGSIKIRRYLNGAVTDQYTTLVDIVGMEALGTTLGWVEQWPNRLFRVKYGDI